MLYVNHRKNSNCSFAKDTTSNRPDPLMSYEFQLFWRDVPLLDIKFLGITGISKKEEKLEWPRNENLLIFNTRGLCLSTLGLHYKAEHVEPPEGASQHMLLSYSSVDCKRSETSASNKCKVARYATKSHCCIYSIVSTGAFWDVDTDRQVACKKWQSCKAESVQKAKWI